MRKLQVTKTKINRKLIKLKLKARTLLRVKAVFRTRITRENSKMVKPTGKLPMEKAKSLKKMTMTEMQRKLSLSSLL